MGLPDQPDRILQHARGIDRAPAKIHQRYPTVLLASTMACSVCGLGELAANSSASWSVGCNSCIVGPIIEHTCSVAALMSFCSTARARLTIACNHMKG